MVNKVLITVAVVLVAFIAAVHGFESVCSKNFIMGEHYPNEEIVFRARVTQGPNGNDLARRVVQYSGQRMITQLQIFDIFTNGTGGVMYMSGGGPYQNFASMFFYSSAHHRGFDFQIIIYAA